MYEKNKKTFLTRRLTALFSLSVSFQVSKRNFPWPERRNTLMCKSEIPFDVLRSSPGEIYEYVRR